MKQSIKDKWVKALQSGDYMQGREVLCVRRSNKGDNFCCLGVLVNEAVGFDITPNKIQSAAVLKEDSNISTQMITPKLLKKLGLDMHVARKLAEMNDAGYSFNHIAIWIKNNVRAT